MSANSNVPLIKKSNSTCVKSHTERWLRLDKFIEDFSSHCAVFADKVTKVRQKNHNATHKEHTLIENP